MSTMKAKLRPEHLFKSIRIKTYSLGHAIVYQGKTFLLDGKNVYHDSDLNVIHMTTEQFNAMATAMK